MRRYARLLRPEPVEQARGRSLRMRRPRACGWSEAGPAFRSIRRCNVHHGAQVHRSSATGDQPEAESELAKLGGQSDQHEFSTPVVNACPIAACPKIAPLRRGHRDSAFRWRGAAGAADRKWSLHVRARIQASQKRAPS